MRRRRSPRSRSDRSSRLASPNVRDQAHHEIIEAVPQSLESREPITSVPLAPPTVGRLPEVMERVGLSRAAIYKLLREGRFPQRVRLGVRAVG